MISAPTMTVPLCADSFRLSAGLSKGLYGRPATYTWSLPNEAATTKKAVLLAALNGDFT